ncbi:hypothetical protein GOP47_0016975 [Adiantum capillus-veneris]|uniref:Uncharacterized protein n=1 Tax=Adiantum capillus-veneris TaxID=13818 RepID=A0A9D4UIR5_ADICA|nr:hypothetical protein GOP47_0016975 [Adiantum capillus-veneris]
MVSIQVSILLGLQEIITCSSFLGEFHIPEVTRIPSQIPAQVVPPCGFATVILSQQDVNVGVTAFRAQVRHPRWIPVHDFMLVANHGVHGK